MSRRLSPTPGGWGGQVALVGLGVTARLVALPSLIPLEPLDYLVSTPSTTATTLLAPLSPTESPSEEVSTTTFTVPSAPLDADQEITLLRSDGTTETLSMADYLFGVVAAEMPASFHIEALKAQAVAARTYALTRQQSGVHLQGVVCDDSTCCQAYVDRETLAEKWGENADFYTDKIRAAVAETDGLMIYYEDAPIEALFFAAAAGRTVDAADVWGNEVAYLVGVNSPEGTEVPNYYSQTTLSKSQVESTILAAYPTAQLGSDTSNWLQNPTYTPSGSVATLEVGGLTLTGSQLRTLFALRSATFSLHWEGSTLVFNVTGYGHGVGMSQYGANALASEGMDFLEILGWYYTGTTVE